MEAEGADETTALQAGVLVVAHGMGCRLAAEALGGGAARGAAAAAPGTVLRCIFAAPDVVPDRFLKRLSAFPWGSR